jgi:hypothetical protein
LWLGAVKIGDEGEHVCRAERVLAAPRGELCGRRGLEENSIEPSIETSYRIKKEVGQFLLFVFFFTFCLQLGTAKKKKKKKDASPSLLMLVLFLKR